jgi:hypothetical protein
VCVPPRSDSGWELASSAPDLSTISTLPPMRSAQCAARSGRSCAARPAEMDSAANADTDSASSFAALVTRSRSPRE